MKTFEISGETATLISLYLKILEKTTPELEKDILEYQEYIISKAGKEYLDMNGGYEQACLEAKYYDKKTKEIHTDVWIVGQDTKYFNGVVNVINKYNSEDLNKYYPEDLKYSNITGFILSEILKNKYGISMKAIDPNTNKLELNPFKLPEEFIKEYKM